MGGNQENIRHADRKFLLQTKNGETAFDRVIFAMPVRQAVKLLKGSSREPSLAPCENNTAAKMILEDVKKAVPV